MKIWKVYKTGSVFLRQTVEMIVEGEDVIQAVGKALNTGDVESIFIVILVGEKRE